MVTSFVILCVILICVIAFVCTFAFAWVGVAYLFVGLTFIALLVARFMSSLVTRLMGRRGRRIRSRKER